MYRSDTLSPVRLFSQAIGCAFTIALAGCGSGGGSSSGPSAGGVGQLSARVFWQQSDSGDALDAALSGTAPEGGFGTDLPAAVTTVRIDFAPAVGEACCVAIDPSELEVDPVSGRRSVVLAMIPAGAGSLTIAGFPGSTAAAPPGVFATCELEPAAAASSCTIGSLDGPSFLSDPTSVEVRAGSEVNAGDILVPAVPFILTSTLAPSPGETANAPFSVGATVAFSGNDLPVDQIVIGTTPGGNVPVSLSFCDDASNTPCSNGGALEVRGLRAEGSSAPITTASATVEIVATRLDGKPPLRLTYDVAVAPADSPTPSPTTAAAATNTPIPTSTRPPVPTSTRRPPATATTTTTRTPASTNTPRRTDTPGPPTATPNAMCGAAPASGCRQSIEGNRATLIVSRPSNPNSSRLLFRWDRGNFTTRSDFGDPGLTTSYALCIYDEVGGVPTLARQIFLPPGPDCSEASTGCWRITDDGFRYDDPAGAREGVEQIVLEAGAPGRAAIRYRAAGINFNPPQLPFSQNQTVVVQVKNDHEGGHCWEARFSRPAARNDGGVFRDSGDSPSLQ